MTKQELIEHIKFDLGSNYTTESGDIVLTSIVDDVITDALYTSNRRFKASKSDEALNEQIGILATEIKRAVKTIYLQRGAEDVSSNSQSGVSSTYDDAMRRLREDIIRNGKRILA